MKFQYIIQTITISSCIFLSFQKRRLGALNVKVLLREREMWRNVEFIGTMKLVSMGLTDSWQLSQFLTVSRELAVFINDSWETGSWEDFTLP